MEFRAFATDSPEHVAALRLREEILRRPLGLTITPAELERDQGCCHLGAFEEAGDTVPVAVLLLQPLEGGTVQMRQVAVAETRQRGGIGAALIAYAETFARGRGFTDLIAHARGTAVGFYERIGYRVEGEEFTEQTIPHRLVTKRL